MVNVWDFVKTILSSSTLKSLGGKGLVVKTPVIGSDATSLSAPAAKTNWKILMV